MNNLIPLVCVVGPTAVGKTKLATAIHRSRPSVLISADSRQVYSGMDLVTGKDHDLDLNLFGIDLVPPDADFSPNHWCKLVETKIKHANRLGKLAIVVGGTGFYLKNLLEPPDTLGIPQNQKLRSELAQKTLKELQTALKTQNPHRFAKLNPSDVNNPRRLIRALEVLAALPPQTPQSITVRPRYQSYFIGILPPSDKSRYLAQITARVKLRLKFGAIEETIALLHQYSPDLPSFTALGYRHIIRHLQGKLTLAELVDLWAQDEYLYAKRQMLYLNKHFKINWYSCESPALLDLVFAQLDAWYAKLST